MYLGIELKCILFSIVKMKKFWIYMFIILGLTIGFVKWQESYQSQENLDNFDEKWAVQNINDLEKSVNDITKQLYELDTAEKNWDNDEISEKYREVRAEIVRVITDINQTTKKVANTLRKIAIYKKEIIKTAEELKDTREWKSDTKEYIEQFANFAYKLDNEIYNNQTDTIDDIKLLAKSDNIPRTLVGESLVRSMLLQFNELMWDLDTNEADKLERIKKLNLMKIETKNDIKDYNNQLDSLQQKKNYLVRFIDLYKNKQLKNNNFEKILTTRKDVDDMMMLFVDDIIRKDYKVSFKIDDKIKLLNKMQDDSLKETSPLAWPLYPIYRIDSYFGDKAFEKQYWVPNRWLSLASSQWTPVFSVRDWVVYHVSDTDWFGINRVMIVHMRWYVSAYMFLNKIEIKEWDVIKRWQLIWYSWWEPWTRWAWFVSNWPNLSFITFKNWVAIDPLPELDLSVVQNKDVLPDQYLVKYLNDKYARPIDITNIEFASGGTQLERADDFLSRYGVGIYKELAFWEDVVKDTNIDRDVAICIAFAESTLWKYLTTANNIWNVWNNDRGDRIGYGWAFAWARMIPLTLNNQFLWNYHTIKQLSRYGNDDGKIYASSPINRQTNVLKCLSQIKGYYVPEDFPFRTWLNPNMWDEDNGDEKDAIMSGANVVVKK